MLITVIIPTYNAEKYLINTIDSVINQTFGFENIELIIVDDNSTDGTKNLILDLAKKYKNIIPILLEDNSGSPSKPRNIGIKKASTNYIMFLDSDDFYYPEMCEKMYLNITGSSCDVVTCRYRQFINGKYNRRKSFLDDLDSFIKIDSIDEFPDLMTLGFPTMIWTKIFKKSVIIDKNILFPEGEFYEDVYFCASFYEVAKGIIVLNDFYGYKYNVRIGKSKSNSQLFNKESFMKQFKGFKRITAFFKGENFPFIPELVVDMTKIFLYSDLNKECQKRFLNEMNSFYKDYKLTTKLNTASLPLNIILNIFIKLFSLNNNFSIFTSILIKKLK